MKKLVPVILASIYLLTFSFWSGMVDKADAAFTATLSFANPSDGGSTNLNASGQFSIDVMVNTGGQGSSGADANIIFDNTKLDFVASASTWGSFYNSHAPNFIVSTNTIKAGVYNTSGLSTNSGKIATLVFSTKTGVTLPTTAAFSFQFIGASVANTTDSNVLIVNSGGDPEDILNAVTNATITINAYVAPPATPTISSLNPTHGAAAGGYNVAINGSNFASGAVVRWAGTVVTSTFSSASLINVPSIPAGTAGGTASVTVTVGSATSSAATFTYDTVAPTAPNISSIVPSQGPEAGGTSVTLTGTNFGNTEGTVTIAGQTVSVANVTWTNTSITFTTPAYTVSTDTPVNVTITTAGTSPLTSAAVSFTYINEGTTVVDPTNPDISYLSPVSGRADQDITVTIYGSNFGSAQGTVKFGAYPATITSWTTGTIVVHAPQLGVIQADVPYVVTVTRTDGKSDTAYYTYTAPPSTGGTGTPGGTTTTPGGNTTTPNSGMPTGAWAGIISANGILAFLIKRRLF